MITQEQILEALSTVIDPDLKKDLVTLKMIENIEINENKISFDLILTTPACPLKDYLKSQCLAALHTKLGANIDVTLTFGAKVTTHRKDKEELLPNVKNIIAVGSGKGGVGKSTVSVNLALALAQTGATVGLIDADIYGPSIPIMFGLEDAHPEVVEEGETQRVIPIEKYGVKVLSIGFFVDPAKALIWRGPMASNALMQLFTDGDWGTLDYVIIDMPPGTGDIQLTLSQRLKLSGVVVVSTPQQVALADARKAINMFQTDPIQVPVLGLVENMAWFTPEELPQNKYYIFGKGGAKKLAEELQVPLLAQIPLVQGVCDAGDAGAPIVLQQHTIVAEAFKVMAEKTAQQMAIHNAGK